MHPITHLVVQAENANSAPVVPPPLPRRRRRRRRAAADPFEPTASLVELLRLRARQLNGAARIH